VSLSVSREHKKERLIIYSFVLGADYMESFQPGLSWPKEKILLKHIKRLHHQNSISGCVSARAKISARFKLPGLKFQPGLKLSPAACNRK
jgi:hypothetical protein